MKFLISNFFLFLPNDCSCSSGGFDIIFDDKPILPVDRKNPLKKKFVEV
jgi:hypothetical protein